MMFSCLKIRRRKPFNPMLGETFEFVTEELRFLSEKVEHIPENIMAVYMEGHDYKMWAYSIPKPQFRFFGGRGMIEVNLVGQVDVYLKKYDQHLTFNRPMICLKNLIYGEITMDMGS